MNTEDYPPCKCDVCGEIIEHPSFRRSAGDLVVCSDHCFRKAQGLMWGLINRNSQYVRNLKLSEEALNQVLKEKN